MTNNSSVLALKYRPQVPRDLIGQEVIIETIVNGIKSEKTPNAYLFTGIRGVGKTTIARIIAKALNCQNGIDNLCENNFCENCNSIINSNHIDVLEMDAASRTGVDDVRELIEFSRYGPTSSKYKIFIIDEVHMLSKQAFNALLKTLEEPPQNVKFIFATTEIKKIPATIISRCQKFDLQRVDLKTLSNHLKSICQNESISFENDSISHICKASEGSVRDALSLLDQAASLCGDNIKEQTVLNMLGLNGYEKNIELFELCLSNQCSEALKVYDDILQNGVQPLQIISNLLEISHLASKINVIKSDTNMTESIQKKISEISTNGLPKLVRLWQILIKSIEELKYAPNEEQAGSMAIIKLCYGSSLPDPSQFLEKMSEQTNTQSENKQTKISEIPNSKEKAVKDNITNYKEEKSNNDQTNVSEVPDSQDKLNNEVIVNNEEKLENFKNPESFEDMLDLLLKNRESLLHAQLINNVHLISFEQLNIKLRLKFKSDTEILKNLSSTLEKITKNKWNVTHSEEDGEKTIVEKQNIKLNEQKEQIKTNPHFAEVFKHFPQAEITSIDDKKSN